MPDRSYPVQPAPDVQDRAAAPPRPLVQRFVASPAVRSGYTSAVVHVILLTLLALLWIEPPDRRRPRPLELAFTAPRPEAATAGAERAEADEPVTVRTTGVAPAEAASSGGEAPGAEAILVDSTGAAEPAPRLPGITAVSVATETPQPQSPDSSLAATPHPASPASPPAGATLPPPPPVATGSSAGYAARRHTNRAAAIRAHGGTAASEAAVDRGLAWLARHQAADGSWRFDLSQCRCDGSCSQPGTISSTTAATGIALLPFLGAGNTQIEGPYQETVARGFYSLRGRMRPTARGGDLCEGTMYGQGVATLALAEAYGMTRDDLLARPLVDAVRFIVTAQDTYGGGWRYLPGQSGDTTVTAWQLAALKSAALAGLEVPSPTIDGIRRFLDRVQARSGEAYGYLGSQPQPCTSAIGLFCRLHTAWEERERLERGLAALARGGPVDDAVYLNFYLSQALLQADHAAWPRWNARNRDQLVARQAAFGHEQGSWVFADRETAPGGRLAHTALALLTLEVYYRLLPLYRPEAVGHEF
jgi:hypothetical protein